MQTNLWVKHHDIHGAHKASKHNRVDDGKCNKVSFEGLAKNRVRRYQCSKCLEWVHGVKPVHPTLIRFSSPEDSLGILNAIIQALRHEEKESDSNKAHDLKSFSVRVSFRTGTIYAPGTYYSRVENKHGSALTTYHSKIASENWSNGHTEKHGAVEPAFYSVSPFSNHITTSSFETDLVPHFARCARCSRQHNSMQLPWWEWRCHYSSWFQLLPTGRAENIPEAFQQID